MQADFYVMAPGAALLSEADLLNFGEALPAAMVDLQDARASLSIYDDEGEELGGWVDIFGSMLTALCLEGPVALAAGERLDYRFAAYDETAALSVVDGRAHVEGADFGSFDCEVAPLVAALVECGARFVALMRHLPPDDYADTVAYLEERLASARAAVAG